MTKCRLTRALAFVFLLLVMKHCTMFTRKLKCALEKDFSYARTKKIDLFRDF